jgi:multiple sugar transport system permease protein
MPVLPLATARWMGTKHFVEAFQGGPLLGSLGKTLFYAVGMLPIQLLLAVCLACLLNNQVRGQRYWRFLYFSPMVTSVVSVSLIFVALFQGARYGWVNASLLELGLIEDILIFLDNERTFLWCVIVLAIWHGLAFNIIIFLAGLQQIPEQLYEAAEVDGAGWVRRFRHISLPGLQPQIFFALIVGGIWSFQVFEPIYMLGGGAGEAGTKFGPNDAGLTLVPLIYQAGFEDFQMGRASALAYILFALIFMLTLIQVKVLRRGA